MAYTPINWQTGDTITAEKMNKMDNGWGVQNTQLFSETVTTTAQSGMNSGALSYRTLINSASIVVTFNGTDYTCSRIEVFGQYFYGGFSESGPVFSEYPFAISSSSANGNLIYTENAGTYTVAVSVQTIEWSNDFSAVVNEAVNMPVTPLLCVSGVTTYNEIDSAYDTQRLMYFTDEHINPAYHWYVITFADAQRGRFEFYPENANLNVTIVDNLFTVTSV